MRAALCLALPVLVALAACWSSPPPAQPRVTTPVADPQPTTSAPASVAETAPADDDGDGDETVLNAKRWKFAQFFNRLKRKIGNAWLPTDVWKVLPAKRRDAYGTATRTTMLELEVAPNGDLVRAAVVTRSGVPELDVEAIRSAQEASPFEAPPPGAPAVFKFSFIFEIDTQTGTTGVVR